MRQPKVRARLKKKDHHLHKFTPSQMKKVEVLSNTWKQTQRPKQNEETEKYVQNERIRQKLQK